jgi:hypothetical protein
VRAIALRLKPRQIGRTGVSIVGSAAPVDRTIGRGHDLLGAEVAKLFMVSS